MKKSRFFVVLFCLSTLLILVVNFVTWKRWVEDLRTTKYAGGDLARMGYLPGVKMQRSFYNDLPMRHLEYSEYRGEKIDVLTIGDSFSNVTALGINVYYQDHLATQKNLSVLNFTHVEDGKFYPHTALIKLVNSGEIDKISPRYVLLETVERSAVQRLGRDLDFSQSYTAEEFNRFRNYTVESVPYKPQLFDFITTANAKYLHNTLRYRYSDHNSDKNVYIARLKNNFFTVKDGNLLAYWFEDTRNIKASTPEAVAKLNANLNTLAQILATKGIKLIFMPVVDKYNLYRDYLIDDSLPRSRFFETLRPLKKDYLFIDTKALLAAELAKGEKDVFFADDTHWTSKAGAAIFSQVTLP